MLEVGLTRLVNPHHLSRTPGNRTGASCSKNDTVAVTSLSQFAIIFIQKTKKNNFMSVVVRAEMAAVVGAPPWGFVIEHVQLFFTGKNIALQVRP